LLEHPHYTRPAVFRGHAVPSVLLGGDHAAIARWRHASALRRTWALRPDLRPSQRLPPGHPVYVAVPPAALPEAAALAAVVRRHAAAGLVVLGEGADGPGVLERWLHATGGHVSVAVLSDPKALRRRLHRGAAAEPRFVRVVEAGMLCEPGQDPPCEHPELLLDLLRLEPASGAAPPGTHPPGALGPVVLWVHPDPPPVGLPIHASYAPPAVVPLELSHATATDPAGHQGHDLTSSPELGIAQGLAIDDVIADISRPRPRPAAMAHAALTGLREPG
jgi:hypothetical protein